jgi:DMSO reductase family type II enzyme heme b subunit
MGWVVLSGCSKAPPAAPTEVVMGASRDLPADPGDAAWQAVPEFVAQLVLQDLVEPRLLKVSTPSVRVRAMQNGTEVAFRIEWADATRNEMPGPASFSDACAVQVPASAEATVPAPQMGEPGRRVEITYWNAAWQAIVDGRGDSITNIYPNATVDHYPFDAESLKEKPDARREMAARYSPARALGNNMGGPRTTPVQDLMAEGPGTITPAGTASSRGKGSRTESGWAVVIARPLPKGVGAESKSQIAFAVWEGSQQEVGSRKMRTGWIPLAMQARP